MKKNISIIAHRGGRGPHPENTLPAFKHAIALDVQALEMDVRYDYINKRFFLEHDFFHTSKARRNLFDPVIDGIPKDVFLLVEIKTARFFSSSIFIRHFVDLYNDKLKGRPIMIQSFNPFALCRLRRHLPDVSVGFLCANPFWNVIFKLLYKRIQPQSYNLHRRILSQENVQFGRKHGWQILAFVLNRPAEWDRALELKVDGIITDKPTDLSDYLHHHVKTQ